MKSAGRLLWGDKQRFSIHSSIVYTPKGLIIMGTAVITGGGTGLGKELAKQLSDKGYDILLVGRREQPLKETVQSILASGGHATYDIMDVRSRTEIEQTLSTWGSRDIELLVHNAGVGYFGPLESSTDEEMVATFETNVFGPIRLTKAMIEAVPIALLLLSMSSRRPGSVARRMKPFMPPVNLH
ncbi:SDR family NAD(P)-dependent oxidoreductase [Rossellomorea sp. H39__3]